MNHKKDKDQNAEKDPFKGKGTFPIYMPDHSNAEDNKHNKPGSDMSHEKENSKMTKPTTHDITRQHDKPSSKRKK